MDEKSAIFLDSLDVPFIKIGSGDVNNLRLLKLGKRRTLQNCFNDHKNNCEILRKLFFFFLIFWGLVSIPMAKGYGYGITLLLN
jgi:hypothetical protein